MADEPQEVVARAFGAANRARLLDTYFESVAPEPVTVESSWRHVYHLLMWIDRTIGLAHCYESDKCQPGRPWYARSLTFHSWLASELGLEPATLAPAVDWLFTTASRDLARSAQVRADGLSATTLMQRKPYEGHGMPLPGVDPDLERLITEALEHAYDVLPADDFVRNLTLEIQTYLSAENKRKNLVGEGFEDTLAWLLRRVPEISSQFDVYARPALHDLPGFHRPRGKDKVSKVDLALVRRADNYRVLVSCKWSVRSDREDQFDSDFEKYSGLESLGEEFRYVLITNEFDPARLASSCNRQRGNQRMFHDVVHVNPAGPLAVYATPVRNTRDGGGVAAAREHITSGRLLSLAGWLERLQHL